MSETGLMVVPVRAGSGTVSLRCGRSPSGERVGIAFTSEARLVAAMGDQPWIHVHERALKAMLRPLGIRRIQVDPPVVAVTPCVPLAATCESALNPQDVQVSLRPLVPGLRGRIGWMA